MWLFCIALGSVIVLIVLLSLFAGSGSSETWTVSRGNAYRKSGRYHLTVLDLLKDGLLCASSCSLIVFSLAQPDACLRLEVRLSYFASVTCIFILKVNL